MLKTIATILFLSFINMAFGQMEFETIEKEINSLKTKEQINDYWIKLHKIDQDNAGSPNPDAIIPAYNLYAVSLLIEKFGYPTSAAFGYPSYVVPWLVWIHNVSAELNVYTFPILIKGKELNQLPDGRYPNYFVGGFLLYNYGFDMEFDPDLNTGDNAIILKYQALFEKANHTVDPNKVLLIAKEYIQTLNYSDKNILGPWMFMEHGTKKTFSIMKRDDYKWYLKTQLEGQSAMYQCIKATDKNLKKFEYSSGFNMFHLTISDNNKLQLRDQNGNIKKESE